MSEWVFRNQTTFKAGYCYWMQILQPLQNPRKPNICVKALQKLFSFSSKWSAYMTIKTHESKSMKYELGQGTVELNWVADVVD